MDMMVIAGYIGMAILGGVLGWFFSGMLINFKKMMDKKKVLKNIAKQEQDIFYVPNAQGVQEKVSLKEYVGIKQENTDDKNE